jgi:DNA-binding response OmpR family regulator
MGTQYWARVFVVEDDFITAKSLKHTLEDLGYNVVGIAASGKEALEKISYMRPDLVLMDIKIKGPMDGVFTAQRVQALYDIPVVYLTAFSDDDTVKRVLHSKSYGYIVKPYVAEELFGVIEKALRQHRTKKQIKGTNRSEGL